MMNARWPRQVHSNDEIAAQKAVFDQLCVVADLLRVMISQQREQNENSKGSDYS